MYNHISTNPAAKVISMTVEQASFADSVVAYAGKSFPAKGPTIISPGIRVKELNSTGMTLHPFMAILLKQVAARLSDIELALDCNDVSSLQFSTHVLKDLFIAINMQEASRYAGQMEEMVNENKLRKAKYLLQVIKKIIAQLVQANSPLIGS